MKGLQGVTVDQNTYDEDAGHATFKGKISTDQGDTFGYDVDWYDTRADVSLILEDNKPVKLGPFVDEEGVHNAGQVSSRVFLKVVQFHSFTPFSHVS